MRKATLLLCFIMMVVACSKDDDVEFLFDVSDSDLFFPHSESVNFLGIVSNASWEITNDIPNWCSVEKLSGEGIASIGINVLSNNTNESRSFELEIKSNKETIKTRIRQSSKMEENYLVISYTNFYLAPEGERISLSIETNNDWAIKNIPSWCYIENSSGGEGKHDVIIIVEPNPDSQNREVVLDIAADTCVKKVKIIQEELLPDNVIHLRVAGTLGSELCRRKINLPTELSIYGQMNADDFRTLREIKVLTTLDISKVDIIKSISLINLPDGSSPFWGFCEADIIPQGAFGGCSNLKSIQLPNAVKEIDRMAFMNCSSLESISLPSQLERLQDGVFFDCLNLKTITLPLLLNSISDAAFQGCILLEDIRWNTKIDHIGSLAFANCISLKEVSLPDCITTLSYCSFSGCINMKSIKLSKQISYLPTSVFLGCENLETILLPEKLETIDSGAFEGCASLKSISIPKSIGSIGGYVFEGCASLKNIYIHQPIPPTTYWSTFYNKSGWGSCIVHVPMGARTAYDVPYWNIYFKNIVEF